MQAPHDLGPALDLAADCSHCFALCCVVPAFARSADFAIDKPARHACPNLAPDFGCRVHSELRPRGFVGCTTYDCFGAGQHLAQVTFGGHDWRESPAIAASMFEAFPVMRALHELLWYLTEAATLCSERSLLDDVAAALHDIAALSSSTPDQLVALDVDAVRGRAYKLLSRVSELVRGSVAGRRTDHRGADLIGATLRGSDLRGRKPARCLLVRCRSAWRQPRSGRRHRRRLQNGRPARCRPLDDDLPAAVAAGRRAWRRQDPAAGESGAACVLVGRLTGSARGSEPDRLADAWDEVVTRPLAGEQDDLLAARGLTEEPVHLAQAAGI